MPHVAGNIEHPTPNTEWVSGAHGVTRLTLPTLFGVSLLDAEQLHFEDQYAVGRNRRAGALVAVG
jgi:hypothetical protein